MDPDVRTDARSRRTVRHRTVRSAHCSGAKYS